MGAAVEVVVNKQMFVLTKNNKHFCDLFCKVLVEFVTEIDLIPLSLVFKDENAAFVEFHWIEEAQPSLRKGFQESLEIWFYHDEVQGAGKLMDVESSV